jgi:hypothetical protein
MCGMIDGYHSFGGRSYLHLHVRGRVTCTLKREEAGSCTTFQTIISNYCRQIKLYETRLTRTLPSRYEYKRKIRAVTCMCGYVLQFDPALHGAYSYSSTFFNLV